MMITIVTRLTDIAPDKNMKRKPILRKHCKICHDVTMRLKRPRMALAQAASTIDIDHAQNLLSCVQ